MVLVKIDKYFAILTIESIPWDFNWTFIKKNYNNNNIDMAPCP